MTAETPESNHSVVLMTWFLENWKKVAIAAGVAIAVVAGIYLTNHLKSERAADASRALVELRAGASRTAQPKAEDYQRIAAAYDGTESGRQASLLAAGALFDAGKYEEARAQFDKFSQVNPRSPLAPQAALGAAASLDALKRSDEALAAYQAVANRFPNESTFMQAKLAAARLLEAKGQGAEAYRAYQEMISRGGASAWRMDIARRMDELLRRHPELAAPPATNAPAAGTPATAPAVPTVPTVPQK